MVDDKQDLKRMTLQRLDENERYRLLLLGVDEQTRAKIDGLVKAFIGDLSDSLSKLNEPEVKKKLMEMLKHG